MADQDMVRQLLTDLGLPDIPFSGACRLGKKQTVNVYANANDQDNSDVNERDRTELLDAPVAAASTDGADN